MKKLITRHGNNPPIALEGPVFVRTAELVDGYGPKPAVPVPAFAEASPEDNPCQLYRSGYIKGQEDLLEEILNHLIMEGYSREEAMSSIGRDK